MPKSKGTKATPNNEERNENEHINQWEHQLLDFTNYATEYIRHYKKAQQGNKNSLAIYPYMNLKWEALNKQLNTAIKKNLLSEKQIKKVVKTQATLLNTCLE
jgi:hypothetical protein